MIDQQIIKDGNKAVAVILDIEEYNRLKEIEQDYEDYYAAMETKLMNKKWTSHKQLRKELAI
jgi:PHD/YefM family antitoxin component YafN of YafNO toxin-antitoxin module